MRDGFAIEGDWRNDVIVVHLAMDGLGSRDFASLLQILDDAEQEHAARFHFDADRHSYIAAHGLLRLLIGAWTGRPAAQLAFNAGPYGKPGLVRGGAAFNLSHTRGMVAVAISPQGDVGVDVEQSGASRDPELDIADRWFSPDEVAQIGAEAEDADKRERFMRIWNLKEAVIKATGRGLSQELTGFTVTPPAPGTEDAGLVCHEAWLRECGQWRLSQWQVDDHLIAAASLSGPGRPIRLLQMTGDKLATLADGVPVLA